MSLDLGNVPNGATLYIPFATYNANGASITMTGLAVTDIEIYKNGSVTQRSSDAGYTLLDTDGIDFDGLTGIHGFSVNTGDNTDAGFFAVGSFYWVVVSAITVNAETVNFIAATFRIVEAESTTGRVEANTGQTLRRATAQSGAAAEITLDTGASTTNDYYNGAIVSLVGGTGAGQSRYILDYVGATRVATIYPNWAANPASDSVFVVSSWGAVDVRVWRGSTPNVVVSGRMDSSVGAMAADVMTGAAAAADLTTELQTGLATAAALATVDTVVDAIKLSTDNLPSDPADASVIAGRFDTLDTAVADLPTNAELATSQASADDATLAAIAALNNLSAAQVNAEVDTALADYDGPTNTEMTTAFGTADDAVLAAIAALNNLSAAAVNAEVDTALTDYDGPTNTELTTALGLVDDDILAAIIELDAAIADLPTNAELATGFGTADDAVLAILGTPAVTIADDIAGVSGGSGLDAAGVRAAVGLATANLDDQFDAISAGSGLDATGVRAALGLGAANLDVQLAGPLAANVTQVNSIAVTGLGTAAYPWKPV